MSGHCRVCGETICVCDEKIETISEKIETISEENRMSELCKLDGFHPIPALGAMKLALKALQNTRTHPLTDAEQYEIEMDAMEALDDAIEDQRERIVFPTMLRKMWSGGEVQQWLDENVNGGSGVN